MGINIGPKPVKKNNKGDLRPTKRKVTFKDDLEQSKISTINRANSEDFTSKAFTDFKHKKPVAKTIDTDTRGLNQVQPGPVTPLKKQEIARFGSGSKGIKMKGKC